MSQASMYCFFFFFNDTATTEIYTLSLHDALPILFVRKRPIGHQIRISPELQSAGDMRRRLVRSEEHTSELQSPDHLVCRLLLEKKKKQYIKASKGRHAVLICKTSIMSVHAHSDYV